MAKNWITVPRRSAYATTYDVDRHFFSSNDSALIKQIVRTHAPKFQYDDVRPVLSMVNDVLDHLATPLNTVAETGLVAATQLHKDKLDNKVLKGKLAHPINMMSREIIGKCAVRGESHWVTIDLLTSLSIYPWEAKVAITFAAFAINYGKFRLVEKFHTKDPLAKNIATLKDIPYLIADVDEIQKKFKAVLDLLHLAMNLTHCIIEVIELTELYISRESPEMKAATAHIPIAVYCIVRVLLVCSYTVPSFVRVRMEYIVSTAESWEIISLTHKLLEITEHLQNRLRICKELVDKKREEEVYATFVRTMESAHNDNIKVLRAIIHSELEDESSLYDGTKSTNESLEVLRLKYVLLLITDLDVPREELNVLYLIYNQGPTRHEYEVLWLPIVDPTSPTFQDSVFYDLRNNNMPWYSVHHPSLVEPVAIGYIRDAWKFVDTPIIVVLDPQGKLVNLNALPMTWIWGWTAFPFTNAREAALWSESTWNIDLLADDIDLRIPEWIRERKLICLYGGADVEWIRTFIGIARFVARDLKVNMEMLYVGKRNHRGRVQRCHEIIDREKLSHVFPVADYYAYVLFFWMRLQSMLDSKRNIGMTRDNDRIVEEITEVLTFDSSDQTWAVFCRGDDEITKANGEKLLHVLDNFQNWAYLVDHPDKFVTVLDEQLRGFRPDHHCNKLILPGYAGYIPDMVICSDCGKTMEKYVMFRCCTD